MLKIRYYFEINFKRTIYSACCETFFSLYQYMTDGMAEIYPIKNDRYYSLKQVYLDSVNDEKCYYDT